MDGWTTITVELVEGRGQDFWPRPGRVMVGAGHMTLRSLATAIDTAFARWDRAHLHLFRLGDGTYVAPLERFDEAPSGAVDDLEMTLADLTPGSAFVYEFDMGDGWTHLCTVGQETVDPDAVLGQQPDVPMPCAGWGDLPDQYGRTHRDDDGSGEVPEQPNPPTSDLPALLPHWGPGAGPPRGQGQSRSPWDRESMTALRGAMARDDADELLTLLDQHPLADVAHHVGGWVATRLAEDKPRPELRGLAVQLRAELDARGSEGDLALSELLAAVMSGRPLPLEPTPVTLAEVELALENDSLEMGHWGDLDTGTWELTGDFVDNDVDEDDLDEAGYVAATLNTGRNESWHDMADFTRTIEDDDLADRLERAIHGRGAFRMFGDIVHRNEGLRDRWEVFRSERELARARAWLASQGRTPKS